MYDRSLPSYQTCSVFLILAAVTFLSPERNVSGQTTDPTNLCCGKVHTQYRRDFIYQLISLRLNDVGNITFRCSHRVCALDRSTSLGVMYLGATDTVTISMASCDEDKVINIMENPQPSRKYQIQGLCLCLDLNISPHNLSRLDEGGTNSSVIVLASFYANETDASNVITPAEAEKTSNVVNVAYTCTASERSSDVGTAKDSSNFTNTALSLSSGSSNILSVTTNTSENTTVEVNFASISPVWNNETLHINVSHDDETTLPSVAVPTSHPNNSRCENCEAGEGPTERDVAFRTCGQNVDLTGTSEQ